MKDAMLSIAMVIALMIGFSFAQDVYAGGHEGHNTQACQKACTSCKEVCEKTLAYCENKGGKYVEPKLIAALKDCITTCTASSGLLSRGSALHAKMCGVCAEACGKCAELCESFDDKVMKDCAAECRQCEKSCKQMSG